MEKKRFISRLIIFVLFLGILVVVYTNNLVVEDTSSRYIEQQKDQVYATYTALYFESDIDYATLAIDNNNAYINFNLMNFIGEDITKRDIEYTIHTPDKYYDNAGNEITPTGENKIHVLDVWNQPKEVGNDTYKYDTEIIENNGELGETAGSYKFTYETIDTGTGTDGEVVTEKGVGKTHNLTVKISRRTDAKYGKFDSENGETISLVIKLNKPYEEIYLIEITILERLIIFSNTSGEMYDTHFEKLNVQTVNTFSHGIDSVGNYTERYVSQSSNKKFTSYGFKVQVYFSNLIIDANSLAQLHIPNNGLGSSNIDITKPYVISLTNNGTSGVLELYVPEASSFDLNFLPTGTDYKFEVVVYAYLYNEDTSKYGYELYDETNGGYAHTNAGKYLVPNRTKEVA